MYRRPLLIALGLLGGIFLVFFALIVAVKELTGGSTPFGAARRVGVVEVYGGILDAKEAVEQLNRFHRDDSVQAIVLRIDSPGGSVGPSQEIHDAVRRIDDDKPVIASMGSVAASGGYYIAAPAREIFANPGTITGSIGVIMEYTNVQELLGKIGLYSEAIKSGPNKDIGSPVRPMSREERALLQALIDDVHSQFVDAVVVGRKLQPAAVRALADGRIFSGRQARDAGLVDQLGGLEAAVGRAAELGGIDGEPEVVYPPGNKPRLIDFFLDEAATRLQGLFSRRQGSGLQYLWPGFN